MISDNLLSEIQVLWGFHSKHYRDSLLEIGFKLHDFVLARLKEADAVAEHARIGLTRSKATEDAGDALGVSRIRINELIRAAMAVELLSENGEVGDLSYGALLEFKLVITRNTFEQKTNKSKRKLTGITELDVGARVPSESEQWQIRSSCAEWAKGLYANAVEHTWARLRIRAEIQRMSKIKSKRYKRTPQSLMRLDSKTLSKSLARATVKDAAELIYETVCNSENPTELAEELSKLLERLCVSV